MALSDACLACSASLLACSLVGFGGGQGVLRVGQDVHAFVCSGLVGLCLVERLLGLFDRGLGVLEVRLCLVVRRLGSS